MTRTTEEASKLTILLEGLDGKRYATYTLYAPTAAFCDVANTLDSLRAHNAIEPDAPEKRLQRVK